MSSQYRSALNIGADKTSSQGQLTTATMENKSDNTSVDVAGDMLTLIKSLAFKKIAQIEKVKRRAATAAKLRAANDARREKKSKEMNEKRKANQKNERCSFGTNRKVWSGSVRSSMTNSARHKPPIKSSHL